MCETVRALKEENKLLFDSANVNSRVIAELEDKNRILELELTKSQERNRTCQQEVLMLIYWTCSKAGELKF